MKTKKQKNFSGWLTVSLILVLSFGSILPVLNIVDVYAAPEEILVDRGDDVGGVGACDNLASGTDDCTLRQAIAFANSNDADTIIRFASDIPSDEIVLIDLFSGLDNLPVIDNDFSVTIDGENQVTITQDDTSVMDASATYDRLFQVGTPGMNSANNVIKNLRIEDFINGIVIFGDNNSVQHVTLRGVDGESVCDNTNTTAQAGISIFPRGATSPSGNAIIDNDIQCFQKGIVAQKVEGTTIVINSIRNNNAMTDGTGPYAGTDMHPCFTAGIELQGTSSGTGSTNNILNNQIHTNGSLRPVSGNCSTQLTDLSEPYAFASAGIILDSGADRFYVIGNQLSHNVSDGISLLNSSANLIQGNNIIEENGTVTPTSGDVTADIGNGIALRCVIDSEGSKNNFIYRNEISRNADNGIFIGKHCESQLSSNIDNAIIENSIFENGRNPGTPPLAADDNDDGIGIDLQVDGELTAFAYSNNNQNISVNDANDPDSGGNNVQNFPVITDADYNPGTGDWTVVGTVTPADGTLVELFQVGCTDPNSLPTCDVDDNNSSGLGFGSGKTFLGRTLSVSGDWEITVPLSAGFSGGLLTSTATTTIITPSLCMAASSADPDLQDTLGNLRVCSTSEFSENFPAQSSQNTSFVFNKIVAPSTVAQGGIVSVNLTLTNLTNTQLSPGEFALNDDLALSGLTFNSGTCTWSVSDPATSGTCTYAGIALTLNSFTALYPDGTLTVQFGATANTLDSQTNTAYFSHPSDNIIIVASDHFTVTSGSGTCSLPDTDPVADFTIDGASHGLNFTTTPGIKIFASIDPTAGNAPLGNEWSIDGVLDSQNGPTASFNLTPGTHTIIHGATDCDGDKDTDLVIITVTSTTGTAGLTLSKSILPSTNLHTGDPVTVTIHATNPISSAVVLNNIVLKDVFTALNQSVTSCRFEKNALPGGGSATCTVAPDGSMTFAVSGGLQPSDVLYIQYTTTVTGGPGTYTNPVSYVISNPVVTPAPAPASAQFTVVSGTSTGSCPGTANVEAEFTINGEPTPSTMNKSAGTYTFTNDDTSGDSPVTYLWSINGVSQPENNNSFTRTLAPGTSTITLMKSDCNGSMDSDTLILTISGGSGVGTGGTFEVTKTVENPKTLYAVDGGSTDSVIYRITIKNNEALARTYTLEDDIPTTYKDTANVLDLAGGTNATVPGLVKVTNISLLPGETKTVRYSVNFKSANDFPLNLYSLDHNADPLDDSDFYADDVKDEDIESDNNDFTDEDEITDAPDGQFVSLGEDGSIIVDVGSKKVIVDGDGDDFGLFTIDNHAKDYDREDEDVKVFVSQDGVNYKKVSGTETFDLGDADMPWARYVKIEDNTSTSVTQSGAAGVDLDAVCLFNLGVAFTNSVNVTMANAVGSASNTIYVDVTEAFDDPLSKSDCRESGTTPVTTETKETRTVELPPPPQPYTPAPAYFPPSMPVLPKTGTETAALPMIVTGLIGMIAWIARRKK